MSKPLFTQIIAVPTRTGDIRDDLVAAIGRAAPDAPRFTIAEAVLPIIDDAIAAERERADAAVARAEAACERTAEDIAQAIEAQLTRRGQTPRFYTGLRAAADIARQHGKRGRRWVT